MEIHQKQSFQDSFKIYFDKTIDLNLIKDNLTKKQDSLSKDLENISKADVIIVSISFEIKKNKKDFEPLKKLIKNIGKKIKKKTLILFETTLPPGTCEKNSHSINFCQEI